MKGIVLEIKNNEAAILSDDGAISKVKNKNYEIGQVIIMKEKKKFKSKFIASAAGLVAAMVVFATGAFAYYTPTSYVSLDVNPSIEYSVNMFDRVLTVKAVNDDGKDIVIDLDAEHKDITKAVEKTIDKLIEAGYITEDENSGVVIAVSNPKENKAKDLAKKIEKETQNHMDEKGKTAKVEVEAVGKERVDRASELNITPGKLNLIEKLKESAADPDKIVIEEWLNKPVKEINKTIKENREQLKNEDAEDKDEVKDTDKEHNENKPIKEEKVKIENPNKPVKEDKQVKEKDAKADSDKDDDKADATVEDVDSDDDADDEGAADDDTKDDDSNDNGKGNDKVKDEKSNNGKSGKNKE